MREILFRGKRIDNGEWVEGCLIHKKSSVGDKTLSLIVGSAEWDNDSDFFHLCNTHRIIPETIGQYTGLTDKNGNKIFEGDIIKLFLDDGIETGVIRYSETACRFMFYENNIMGYGFDNTCIFEIIGNIHDNPELLKENDNDE